jgi:hypothetical protein
MRRVSLVSYYFSEDGQMRSKFILAALIVCGMVSVAGAEFFIIADGNSTASLDLSSTGRGMESWTVNGVNQLYEQSFWYQVDSGPVQRINTLTPAGSYMPGSNELQAAYSGSGFMIAATWTLYGASPGFTQSDIAEVIRIRNTSSTVLDFHFWQFVDLNLLGTPSDALASITGGNTARQYDGILAVSETADVPAPSRYEAGYRQTVLADMQTGILSNNASQANGDLAWAFQWDRQISPGASLIISKDKHLDIVPEPGSLILLAIGAVGLLGYGWRRRP